ncbi:MAG: hypothetical protein ACYTEQ_01465 [Planctomycetota bacterium]|jgi:hypothetical protein
MSKFPINWRALDDERKGALIGQLFDALVYKSPITNPADLGAVQPASHFRREGLSAYSDGTQWNPATMGEGDYLRQASDWHKYQLAAFGELTTYDNNASITWAGGATNPATLVGLTDGDSYHTTLDGANGKITFNVKGWFKITGSVSFSCNKNCEVHGVVYQNTTAKHKAGFRRTIGAVGYGVAVITGFLYIEKSDYICVKLSHNSGANPTILIDHFNINLTREA